MKVILTKHARAAATVALYTALCVALCACAGTTPAPRSHQVNVNLSSDLRQVELAARKLADEYGKAQVLVAFDLDNTLLAMRSGVGSDQWYDWQKWLKSTDSCDPRLVSDRLAAQGALYHIGAMRSTQENAAQIVSALQADGFRTMVVTARGQDFRLPTFRELRRNGLSFRDNTIGPLGGFSDPYTPPDAARAVRFEDGVYMLAGQHKGRLLLALFEKLALALPSAIVFVDDKASNVQAMTEAMLSAGIRAELFIYQKELATRFDADQAREDWNRIQPALTSIEAVMGPVNFDLPPAQENDCAR